MKKLFISLSSIITLLLILVSSTLNAQKGTFKYDDYKEIAPAVQIYFDLGKSEIKTSELAKLQKLVSDLKSKEKYRLIITGHTDSTGSDEINLKLSQKRADIVFDYLAEAKIEEDFMESAFFGRSKPRPVAGATKDEIKMMGRRVEILIIEPPKPKEKPVIADDCKGDTTLKLTNGIKVTMNICEWKKLCKGKQSCIEVNALTSIEDIIESGVPLVDKKGNGKIWAGIYDVKLPIDTCLDETLAFLYELDKEEFKKARLEALEIKEGEYLDKLRARSGRIRLSKSKESIIVDMPLNCSGRQYHASPAGKGKKTCFKDKTGRIEKIYLVSGSPTTIIPAKKEGNKFYVEYNSVPGAKIWVLTTDGEWIKDVDLNAIRKQKSDSELPKGYKLTNKNLVMTAE